MSKRFASLHSNDNGERGFTLVEILVSLVILLILVVAFVPLFTFVAQAVSNNHAKDTATALANSRIEYLRTLPFVVKDEDGGIETDPNVPQLGFVGGNPPGSIPAADAIQVKTVTGKNYTIKTGISWDETGKYKKVSVVVEYPSPFNNEVQVISKFYTIASEEGELDLPESGNIRVQIFDKDGYLFTSAEILVKIVASDGSVQENYTEDGEKLFGILEAGYYTVYAQVSDEVSYRPDQTILDGWLVLSNIQVADNITQNAPFYFDLPGELNLNLEDDDDAIVGNGILGLSWTDGISTKNFSPVIFDESDFTNEEIPSSTIENELGNLWPGGSYSIELTDVLDSTTLKAYYDYDMSVTNTPKPKLNDDSDWNGSFETAGSAIDISVEIESLLKTHLDAATGVTTEPYTYTDPNTDEEITVNQVANWEDQSGKVNNAYSPEAATNKPELIPDVIDGKPVIRFVGSNNQSLTMNNGVECTNKFTIFAVAKSDTTHEIDTLSNRYGGCSGQKYLFGANHKGDLAGAGLSFGTNGISSYEHGANYMPATAIYEHELIGFQVIALEYSDTESTKPTANLYINGELKAEGTQSEKDTVYSPTLIGIGDYGVFTGDVAEILVYDSSLNDANMQLVSEFLLTKYGL